MNILNLILFDKTKAENLNTRNIRIFFSDKSSDKNNLFPRQDRVNTQFKDSGKGETKRDLSKLPHFGQKKVFAGLVEVKAHKMDVKVHIIKGQQQ